MKIKYTIVSLVILLLLNSCEKILMHPKPGENNIQIFDEYAQLSIDKFGLQEVKGIDLGSLADSISPYISDELTEAELFDYMGILTTRMQEGHTDLEDLEGNYYAGYIYYLDYPPAFNFFVTEDYYYGENANPNVQEIAPSDAFYKIQYGFLPQDNEIGYIRITNFELNISDAELEQMMSYLNNAKGIIIDVRGNLGGYINLAARLAAYFTDKEVLFAKNYVKNGPGANDFAVSEMKLTPANSQFRYTNDVVVLYDRITFSSGSLFSIMMYSLDNVTTIGQIFGGGTGEVVDGFLSNGWRYNISTSNLVDSEGRATDNGIEADIPMIINPADSTIDVIIERAILELQ
jgi:hypothetical protein